MRKLEANDLPVEGVLLDRDSRNRRVTERPVPPTVSLLDVFDEVSRKCVRYNSMGVKCVWGRGALCALLQSNTFGES